MSRENFVIFDPHAKYLGRCIRNPLKPGLKLHIDTHASRIKKFKDQFKPYMDMFGVDLQSSFEGTLFRFPLRTLEQARDSDMSKKVYNEQEVTSLFKILFDEADALLLFTQNIQKLTVYTIANEITAQPELVECLTIERNIVKVLKQMQPLLGNSNPENEPKILHAAKRILEASRTDDIQSNGYIVNIEVSGLSLEHIQDHEGRNCHWVVYGAIGTGSAAKLAKKNKTLIPVGGVAAKLHYNEETKTYTPEVLPQNYGQVFCFLPLPIRSELPVQVNGYFAVTSSRTHLHGNEKTEKVDSRSLWNEALMEDPICLAYLEMLSGICTRPEFNSDYIKANMFEYFPSDIAKTTEGRSNAIFYLMKKFLRNVFTGTTVDLLPSLQNWTNGDNFIALDKDARVSEMSQHFTTAFEVIATQSGEPYVDLPLFIYSDLEKCELFDAVKERFMSCKELYDRIILPNIGLLDVHEARELILYALTGFNSKLDASLRAAESIPVKSSSVDQIYRRPDRLVDPYSYLRSLFGEEEGYFPSPLLQETTTVRREQWRTGLQRLGMRDTFLEWDEVIERAKSIADLDLNAGAERARCLVRLLSRMHRDGMPMEIDDLVEIQFLPKKTKPFTWLLPWFGDTFNTMLSMCDVYSSDDYSFLGSVLPISDLDTTQRGDVRKLFEDTDDAKCITPGHIKDQVAAVEAYLSREKNIKDASSIGRAMTSCYRWCDDYARDRGEETQDRVDAIRQLFKHSTFVYISGSTPTLVEPSKCAKVMQTDCTPHLNKLPSEFNYYHNLAKALAIPERFQLPHYITVLRECFEKYHQGAIPQHEQVPILHVIQGLAETVEFNVNNYISDSEPDGDTIYLLNDELRMMPSTDLSINTFDWIPDADPGKMCNNGIAPGHAKLLGVKSNRESVLDSFDCGVPFGQHEELTVRIRHLLEGYPCDKEILKELLQNADDAGASQIHFVLDERQHKTDKIFSESWSHLQGPALLVFNDKGFSKNDLDGIQRLGEGSKSDDAVTTGKYGVGFNCVYHITDTPTLLTRGRDIGETLCAFDPQCRYVPLANRNNPGRMFKVDDRLRGTFPDVFGCYNFPEFDREEFALFRLPLRSQHVADESTFSHKEFPAQEVQNLFGKFLNEMSIALLFLTHVRKISLSRVDSMGKLVKIYETTAQLTKEDTKKKSTYNAAVVKAAKALKSKQSSVDNLPVTETVYEMSIKTSDDYIEQWLLCQRIGFADVAKIPQNLFREYKDARAALLPRGGVAFSLNIKKGQKSSTWCEWLGLGGDKKTPKKPKLFCFLPLPQESCMPMHVNGHFALDNETRHDIYYNVETANFRNQWNQNLLGSVIAKAYIALLQNMKTRVSTEAVKYEKIKPALEKFIHMFPHHPLKEVRLSMQAAQERIYEAIDANNLQLIPVLERARFGVDARLFPKDEVITLKWKGLRDGVYFDDLGKQLPSPTSYGISRPPSPGMVLKNALLNCSFPFTALPFRLLHRFSECRITESVSDVAQGGGDNANNVKLAAKAILEAQQAVIKELIVNPEALLLYLKAYKHNGSKFVLPNNVENSPFTSPSAVEIAFSYVTQAACFKQHIEGLPLLLTHDGILREFQQSTGLILATAFAGLIPKLPHRFLHGVYGGYSANHQELQHNLPSYIKEMDINDFAQILDQRLPKHKFYNQERVPYPGNDFMQWLIILYDFLNEKCFVSANPDGSGPATFNKKALAPLRDWCIVPTVSRDRQYLTWLKGANLLFSPHGDVLVALDKLPLPRVFVPSGYFDGQNMKDILLNKLTAGTDNPYFLLQALVTHLTKVENLSEYVKPNTARDVLSFFNNSLSDIKSEDDVVSLLKRLPLYVSATKKVVPILAASAVVVPDDACVDGVDKIATNSIVFLEPTYRVSELYKFLGCEFPTFEVFYYRHVLRETNLLEKMELYAHIVKLRHHIECRSDKKTKILVESLKQVPLMEKDNGTRCVTEQFYDPTVPLFRVMHTGDDFPTDPYYAEIWHVFLRRIGLISKVTCDMCVAYAKDIASGTRDAGQCSEDLVWHILYGSGDAQSYLFAVKNIAFLPRRNANSQFTEIAKPCETTATLVSYSMCARADYENICWTVVPILPEWAEPNSDQNQLLQTPTIEHVHQHMRHIYTETKSTLSSQPNSFIRVVQDIFVACQKYIEGRVGDDVKTFVKTHVVLSDSGRYYKASQLVFSIDKEWTGIQGILCACPDTFKSLEVFLKKLGMTENISLDQVVWVLKEIHDAANGKYIVGNQGVQALCATKILFLHLQKSTEHVQLTELYLPGITSKHVYMVISHDVFLLDQPEIIRRKFSLNVPILMPMHSDSHETTIIPIDAQKDAIQHLPFHVRPKLVSSRVKETLDTNCLNETIISDAARVLEEKLTSSVFHHCILRLMQHGTKQTASEEEFRQLMDEIETVVSRVQCIGLRTVTTYLLEDDIRTEGSELSKDFFITSVTDHNASMILYIAANTKSNHSIMAKRLAKALLEYPLFKDKQCLREHLNDVIREELESMESFLDQLDIGQFGNWEDKLLSWPEPGEFVPLEYIGVLEQSITRLQIGEYVALEVDDPLLDVNRTHDGEEEAIYIYARVKEILLPDEDADETLPEYYKYKVDTGTGVAIVEAVYLYRLKEHRKQEQTLRDSLEIQAFDGAATDAESSNQPGQQSSPGSNEDSDMPQTLEEIKEYMTKHLIAVKGMGDRERRAAYKRLALLFHPDKNPQRVDMATKAFQFLQNQIDVLESGGDLNESAKRESSGSTSSAGNGWFERNFGSGNFQERANRHYQQQSNFAGFDFASYNRPNRSGRRRGRRNASEPHRANPQPGLARRYMRQAECDIQAVTCDREQPNYEWACQKCHQAADKATKAAQYKVDASYDSPQHATLVACRCDVLTSRLRQIIGPERSMQFPDTWSQFGVPHDRYDTCKAAEGFKIANEIVQKCSNFVNGV